MSLIDKFITEIDKGLKFSTHNYRKNLRQYPAQNIDKDSLNELEKYFCKPDENKSCW